MTSSNIRSQSPTAASMGRDPAVSRIAALMLSNNMPSADKIR